MLAALVHFSEPAHTPWIALASRLSELETSAALEQLMRLGLIQAIGGGPETAYELPRLWARFVRMKRLTEVEQAAEDLAAAAIELAERERRGLARTLENLWPIVTAAFNAAVESGGRTLQRLCAEFSAFAGFYGDASELVQIYLRAEEGAAGRGDFQDAGQRAYEAGGLYRRLEDADNVLACCDRAAEYWKEHPPPRAVLAGLAQLRGLGLGLKNDWAGAIRAYEQSAGEFRVAGDAENLASVRMDLGIAEGQRRRSGGRRTRVSGRGRARPAVWRPGDGGNCHIQYR